MCVSRADVCLARLGVSNSSHMLGEVLVALDVRRELDDTTGGDLRLDHAEPAWVHVDLRPEHVSPLAAAIPLAALFPAGGTARTLFYEEVVCWAHCRDVEARVTGGNGTFV